MRELLARAEGVVFGTVALNATVAGLWMLELVVVTDGVVWVKLTATREVVGLVSVKLLTLKDVAVEETAAASEEAAGLRFRSCSINLAGGWMFLWLRRMAGGAGRVVWRRVLAARAILG